MYVWGSSDSNAFGYIEEQKVIYEPKKINMIIFYDAY